jgi:hypothetical protein
MNVVYKCVVMLSGARRAESKSCSLSWKDELRVPHPIAQFAIGWEITNSISSG